MRGISIKKMLGLIFLVFTGLTMMNSCIGPAGPPGEDGIDGKDGSNGANGANGADGKDGTAVCIVCHNADAEIVAIQEQLKFSLHQTGENYMRNANTSTCQVCHSHQGFMYYVETGNDTIFEPIPNVTRINCRTCHLVHMNYDREDYRLVTAMPVQLKHTGVLMDIGESNLCVNCHQARPAIPFPEPGGGDITIFSSRWGSHHGSQSQVLWGVGGYNLPGSVSYPGQATSSHRIPGCIRCHMAPNAYTAGGHTFNMTYENRGVTEYLYESCLACHPEISEIESFDFHGIQTHVTDLTNALRDILVSRGWLDPVDLVWYASPSMPLTVSADEAGAMYNYFMVNEDNSKGIHNPAYVIALLTNSIESLTPK